MSWLELLWGWLGVKLRPTNGNLRKGLRPSLYRVAYSFEVFDSGSTSYLDLLDKYDEL
jgi:hypothetical protein